MTQVSATASDITHILQSQPLRKSQCLSSNTFFWSKWKHPVFNSLLWIEASKALGCPSPLLAASLSRCKTSTCPISHPAAPGISFVYLLSLRGHWTPLFRKLNWAAWLYVLSSPFLLLCENYLLWEFLLVHPMEPAHSLSTSYHSAVQHSVRDVGQVGEVQWQYQQSSGFTKK